MKREKILLCLFVIHSFCLANISTVVFPKCSIQPTLKWGQQFGTSTTDIGITVKTDRQGNPILIGATDGNLINTNIGDLDGFIIKFDTSGQVLWQQQIGTNKWDRPENMTVDKSDNIIVVGRTRGEIQNQSLGDMDIFMYTFTEYGDLIESQLFGTSSDDHVCKVVVDSNNNRIIAGFTEGTIGDEQFGGTDAYLIKIDESNNELFKVQLGTEETDVIWGLTLDQAQNIYVSGYTLGNLLQNGQGSSFGFIAKYSPFGEPIWIKQYGSSASGSLDVDVRQIVIGPEGNIYATGTCSHNFAGEDAGKTDVLIMKLDPQGDITWKKQFGSNSFDQAHKILYIEGPQNGIIITGHLNGVAYCRMYNLEGDLLWNQNYGKSNSTYGYGMGNYQNQFIYATGYTNYHLFGEEAYGESDVYILKIELDYLENL